MSREVQDTQYLIPTELMDSISDLGPDQEAAAKLGVSYTWLRWVRKNGGAFKSRKAYEDAVGRIESAIGRE